MIPAHLLQPGEFYYTHDDAAVWRRCYISSGLSIQHGRPVHYFRDDYDRPYKVTPPDLLAYYPTEAEALTALLERVDRVRAGVVGLMAVKGVNTQNE